eukprot:Opistho-1_new@56587
MRATSSASGCSRSSSAAAPLYSPRTRASRLGGRPVAGFMAVEEVLIGCLLKQRGRGEGLGPVQLTFARCVASQKGHAQGAKRRRGWPPARLRNAAHGLFGRNPKGMGPDMTLPALKEQVGLSLFWRTFVMLAALLVGSIVLWQQTFKALEFEPRAIQSAQQIASLVNLTRAALVYADSIARVSLIKTLADQEGVRITPREPGDRYTRFAHDFFSERISVELTNTPMYSALI